MVLVRARRRAGCTVDGIESFSHGMHGDHGMPQKATPTSRSALLHGALTERILGVFFQVHFELGFGLAESVYSNAMTCALMDAGLTVEREVPITVFFRGIQVGSFRADQIVESAVLLELKATRVLEQSSESQVINYLRATRLEVALVLHFGDRPRFKRLIFTNDRKLLP
jgi:GxxExxY protein